MRSTEPAKNNIVQHMLELARIQKLICTKLSRWYPSTEADELTAYCVRELDALRVALEGTGE